MLLVGFALLVSAVLIISLDSGTRDSAAATEVHVVASDSFNRTVSGGWGSAEQGGAWTVLDTPASWSVAPGMGSVNVAPGAQQRAVLSGVSVQNAELLAKIVLPRCSGSGTNCIAYLLARVSGGTNPSYYRVGIGQGLGRSTVILRSQRSDGGNLAGDLDTGIPAAAGAVIWVRAQFEGVNPTNVRARAWLDGTTEPASWLLNTSDGTAAEQIAGAVGVRARNEDSAASHTFGYESFLATAFEPPPPPPPPSGTAASDSFQRSVASGWGNAETGGWWTVVGSPWNWSVSPGAGNVSVGAGGQERAYLSTFTVRDVDVLEQVTLPRCAGSTNCTSYVLGRYSPAYNPTYYRVGVGQGAGRPDIFIRAQRSDETNLAGEIDTGLPASEGADVMLRVEFTGANPTTIRARAWLAGTAEPSTWRLSVTDNNSVEQGAGMVGVHLRNEDTAASHSFAIQSYQVTGTAMPVTATPNPTTVGHWLYVVTDGTVYAYDIDNGHKLVKQFAIPEAGKRGLAVAPSQGLLYITECGGSSGCGGKNGGLIAYDLVHDVVAWIANYSFGVDQPAVTPDGSKIYMPHGLDASDGAFSVLDASDGKPIGSIATGTDGHNVIVSPDGAEAYLTGFTGTNFNYAAVVNTSTDQVVRNVGPTVNGIRPFTVNGKRTLMFTTSSNTCGFQVLDLVGGGVLDTVTFGGSCVWTVSTAPNHGISLSPDEKRLYILDSPLDQLKVYDVSGLPTTPPAAVASIQLSSFEGMESPCQSWCQREGWVLNDLSGRYVYVADTGNIISTETLTVVGTLPALQNTRQLVEIEWMNGRPSATSTRFGMGRVTG